MQRKVKEILPKTFDELKALSQGERARLWARYSPQPFNGQLRALWYYMQCRTSHIHLETKYPNKLKKYKSDPAECASVVYQHRYNLLPGTTITRTFRGIDHKILVQEDKTFLYNDKIFPTLSAVAKEITGIKISGPDFFGLNKRKKRND